MKITKVSDMSGKTHTLDINVTQEQIDAWHGGMLIQNAIPNLSPDEREFLMTGVTPQEWDEMFNSPTATFDDMAKKKPEME